MYPWVVIFNSTFYSILFLHFDLSSSPKPGNSKIWMGLTKPQIITQIDNQIKWIQYPSEYRTSLLSNGQNISCCQMVWFSDGCAKSRQLSGFWMVQPSTDIKISICRCLWLNHLKTRHFSMVFNWLKYSKTGLKLVWFQMNQELGCVVFRWLLYIDLLEHRYPV